MSNQIVYRLIVRNRNVPLTFFFAVDKGKLDLSDWSPPVSGDTNNDGLVDFADFLVLSNHFGQETDEGAVAGDFDSDGKVLFSDFLILASNFERSTA